MTSVKSNLKSISEAANLPDLTVNLKDEGFECISKKLEPTPTFPKLSYLLFSQPYRADDVEARLYTLPKRYPITPEKLVELEHSNVPGGALETILNSVQKDEIGPFTAITFTVVYDYEFAKSKNTHRSIDSWVFLGEDASSKYLLLIKDLFWSPEGEEDTKERIFESIKALLDRSLS